MDRSRSDTNPGTAPCVHPDPGFGGCPALREAAPAIAGES